MYLSYYYPVEWAIACLTLDTIDGKTDGVLETLTDCKKKKIKILPPDINESNDSFSIAHDTDGSKCIRFGMLAIKDVGVNVLKAIQRIREVDGEFTSFQNFLDRTINPKTNSTLMNELAKDPENVSYKLNKKTNVEEMKVKNPLSKRNIIPLIKAGAFDSLEPNRYKLYNEFIYFRNKKEEIANDLLVETDYQTAEKLQWEMDTLGFYVSQHPLDSPSFPYVNLANCQNGDRVKIAGLVKEFKKNPTPTKTGKTYYKLNLEFKDGTTLFINVWDNLYDKYRETFKDINAVQKNGNAIVIISGKFSKNKNFTNINLDKIERIRSKQEQLENKKIPENSSDVPDLCSSISLDSDIYNKVG